MILKSRFPNKTWTFKQIQPLPLICKKFEFYNTTINKCDPIVSLPSDCSYPIYSNLKGCLTCPANKIYSDENFSCESTCPKTKNYLNNEKNICYSCNLSCLTCSEYSKCLSCDSQSKYFNLKNYSCLDSCDSFLEVYSDVLNTCVNGKILLNLVQNSSIQMMISGPEKLDIRSTNFTVKLQLLNQTIMSNYSKLMALFDYEWTIDDLSKDYFILINQSSSLFVTLNQNKIIYQSSIEPVFTLNIKFNNQSISILKKYIKILLFNLIPYIQNEQNLIFFNNHMITIDASLSYDEMTLSDNINIKYNQLNVKWECPEPFDRLDACKTKSSILAISNEEYSKILNPAKSNSNQSFIFNVKSLLN